jgi:ectoine hydroxylase-related dioxygenase (phytanoyl-CoA dioxygenase family)
MRVITDVEVETFWRDGVVCLRGVIDAGWLERMARPVEESLRSSAVADLSAMRDQLDEHDAEIEAASARSAPRGQFLAGTDHWREQPEFLEFASCSPLPAIVARLLATTRVWLYEDSVLVKEPGTRETTAFHQDLAYFHLDGEQVCTTWVPLDPVDAESGAVRFARGSHRDRTRFRPNLFVNATPIDGSDGEIVPDLSASPDLLCFDTEPGDVTVHHARTIHGAHGNRSATRRRRAISVRYAGDDVVFRKKPGAPSKPHHARLVENEPLDPIACPQVWP